MKFLIRNLGISENSLYAAVSLFEEYEWGTEYLRNLEFTLPVATRPTIEEANSIVRSKLLEIGVDAAPAN